MVNKIRFKPKDIIDKEFKVSYKGYDAKEVDYFLDFVAADYEFFHENIKSLEEKNKLLREENDKLNDNLDKLKIKLEIVEETKSTLEEKAFSQADVLDRINKLEKGMNER
ncbi:DivIVA domain-containing protein [Spiroplasma endosymbiont of Amphibalanus improvisus]|uniref:DivIVA domain-containing protein n=1 Tax=Spiroplasma endosymbiont of Amphibalanus improvisus TaxID=3066327 RepID=UPI00313C0087